MAEDLYVPDVSGLTVEKAALAYAEAGWYVGPLKHRTKHAGSVLGDDWHTKTTRDPEVIRGWFADHPERGVFWHAGRSGAVIFDVDTPENLHPLVRRAVEEADPPWQATRPATPDRRHLVFRQPPGRRLGNGVGGLKSGWGEIRGQNGIIVVAPSEHENPDGLYRFGQTGPVPVLPAYCAAELPDARAAADAVTDAEVEGFIEEHTAGTRHDALAVQVHAWAAKVDGGESRHDALSGHLTGAMKEAAAGLYPARAAHDAFHDAFVAAVTVDGHGRQGKARSLSEAESEWAGLLAWAVAQAEAADPDETRRRTAERVPSAVEEFDDGFVDDVPSEEAAPPAGGWSPVDLAATVAGLLDGTLTRPEPTVGDFGGGCLFYAGRINSVHGDSTAGKTWTALVTAAQELARGETVVYVDLEDSAAGVVSRLLDDLRVPADAVRGRFVYLHPDEPLSPAAAAGLAALLDARRPSLVVVDSTGEALAIEGANPNADEEVARWFRLLPRLAVRCGAAVLLLDHATKAGDNDLWPIGSQRKRAAVTGAAYLQKVAVPFGRDQDGKAVLVCAKDRHGNYPLRRRVAALTVRGGEITLQPEASTRTTAAADFRPTGYMEKVSRWLEREDGPRSGNQVENARLGNKKHVADALAALVKDGYVTVQPGKRSAQMHAVARPYREDDDAGGLL